MKKSILMLTALLLANLLSAQTTSPDATKPYIILDSTYNLESVNSSNNTVVDIYYDNTSGNAVKGIQFSFSYDKDVFDTPTINL
jgi:hypothetical protein